MNYFISEEYKQQVAYTIVPYGTAFRMQYPSVDNNGGFRFGAGYLILR